MNGKCKLSRLAMMSGIILWFCIVINGCQGSKGALTTGPAEEPLSGTDEPLAGALGLNEISIVTTQSDGTGFLHVWNFDTDPNGNWSPSELLDPSWTLPDVHHFSVAIGDLDGDSFDEIIVPAKCNISLGNGIFINVYEEGGYEYTDGISDVWWTTYYSPQYEDYIIEKTDYWSNEILTADLDNNGDSEIILITNNYLAIFDYEPGVADYRWQGKGTIKMVAQKKIDDLFNPEFDLRGSIVSIDTGNVTGDSTYPDIVLAHNLWDESGEPQGYLVVFKDPGLHGLEESKYYQGAPGSELLYDGLQIGDVDGNKSPEIWTIGATHDTETSFDSHLSYWKWVASDVTYLEENVAFPVEVDVTHPSLNLAVGDILDNLAGDEIALASRNPREVRIYSQSSDSTEYSLDDPIQIPVSSDVLINNMTIHQGKIVVGGAMQDSLSLFLGIIGPIDPPANGAEYGFEWELRDGPGREAWGIAVGP